MDYISNLTAPDLRYYFKHLHQRPMPHAQGHDVLSDFADWPADDPVFGLYKNCGFWTRDEAAILYHCACRNWGEWIDIGAHTGWTSRHLFAAGCLVDAVEPMLAVPAFRERFTENLDDDGRISTFPRRSDEYFDRLKDVNFPPRFAGVVIDGDHDKPWPLHDAQKAAEYVDKDGVILLHDAIGEPVWEAAVWLMDHGFNCRIYWTPHMIACCYRGDFVPPDHVRDPLVDWESVERTMAGFPFERTV